MPSRSSARSSLRTDQSSRSGRVGVMLVRAYQLVLSPFAGGACRFVPSCSAYALEAVNEHGCWRGTWLALRRVGRCHPFGGFGFDPVPPAGAQTHSSPPPAGR